MTESESVVYRVVPKCACSTIGQIMFYSDHGRYFDGDIHDATEGMHKWALEASQPIITENVRGHESYAFTCVRNPYTRILSSFFDKICGIQRNGKRYRGNMVPMLVQKYGLRLEGMTGRRRSIRSNPSALFAVCTRHNPLAAANGSRHSLVRHVGSYLDLHREWGQYDKIFWTENFNDGMSAVLGAI